MSWYSLLGVGIGAWFAASAALAFGIGLVVSYWRRRESTPPGSVVQLPRVAAGAARTRAAG
jgi:hypothetical protein